MLLQSKWARRIHLSTVPAQGYLPNKANPVTGTGFNWSRKSRLTMEYSLYRRAESRRATTPQNA